MDDIRVYIVDFGRFEEGVGEWFTVPVAFEDVKEQLQLDLVQDCYVLYHFDSPYKMNEYQYIDELNEFGRRLAEVKESYLGDTIDDIMRRGWFTCLEELIERWHDILLIPDCENIEDVGRYLSEIREAVNISEDNVIFTHSGALVYEG